MGIKGNTYYKELNTRMVNEVRSRAKEIIFSLLSREGKDKLITSFTNK